MRCCGRAGTTDTCQHCDQPIYHDPEREWIHVGGGMRCEEDPRMYAHPDRRGRGCPPRCEPLPANVS